jgi:hypothetical protein
MPYFRVALSSETFSQVTRETTEHDEVSIEFETEDNAAATIVATSFHPHGTNAETMVKETGAMRMNKNDVGSLLAYLSLIHPMMAEED